jgi:nitrite reductase (NADH) large subunit
LIDEAQVGSPKVWDAWNSSSSGKSSREARMSEPLVIVGNGMAATRLVSELATRALGRHAVAVIGDEPRLAYNRVLLSPLLADEILADDIGLAPTRWWCDRGVTVRYGCGAIAIDPAARTVGLADGTQLRFAKLVLATGSRPARLAVPGMDLPGVLTFRDLDDVAAIARIARAGARVVVIGGGLLGLEAAYGVSKTGARVTVVHLMDRLMERQLDVPAAAMLKRALEARGIAVLCGAATAAITGRGRVEAIALSDGRTIAADAIVVAVGVAPNVALARAAGLKTGRGIAVDDRLETSVPGIFAIGECAEHRGQCYGLVEPAYEQANVLARHLCAEDARYDGSVLATNLKVSGIHVFSAGDFLGAQGTETIVLSDPGLGTYKKLVIAEDRLVGAVLYGDTGDGLWYLELIRSGERIGRFRDDLMFGRALVLRRAA